GDRTRPDDRAAARRHAGRRRRDRSGPADCGIADRDGADRAQGARAGAGTIGGGAPHALGRALPAAAAVNICRMGGAAQRRNPSIFASRGGFRFETGQVFIARLPAGCTIRFMTNHGFKAGNSREQPSFLPPRIEDYVGRDNPVRAIEAYVEALDLEKLGFAYPGSAGGAGQPPYPRGGLTKLYLYSLPHGG